MSRRMPMDSDTVGLWRMDEPGGGSAIDLSNNGNDGTNNGTSAVAVSGMHFDYAREFVRADSDYIDVGDIAALEVSNIGLEIWGKADNWTPGNDQYMVSKFTASKGYALGIISDEIRFYVNTAGGSDYVSYNGALASGYHYFYGGYNGTDMTLGIDGYVVSSIEHSNPGNISYDTEDFLIGAKSDVSNYFDGELAELRVSNRHRYTWEILNTWKAVSDPQDGFTTASGVIAVYNFNNPSEGAVVYDDTENHNGSMTGTVPVVDGPISSSSRQFPGSNSHYLIISDHADFSMENGDLTIAMWIKSNNLSSNNYRMWLDKQDSSGNRSQFYILQKYNDRDTVQAVIRDSGGTSVTHEMANVLVVNQWFCFVWVWDLSEKTLYSYMNGTYHSETANASLNVSDIDSTSDIWIGRHHQGTTPGQFELGSLMFYRGMWTPEQVYNHYKGTNIKEDPWL